MTDLSKLLFSLPATQTQIDRAFIDYPSVRRLWTTSHKLRRTRTVFSKGKTWRGQELAGLDANHAAMTAFCKVESGADLLYQPPPKFSCRVQGKLALKGV